MTPQDSDMCHCYVPNIQIDRMFYIYQYHAESNLHVTS